MANTKSAKKSALQNEKRRQRNLARRTAIKTAIKKTLIAIEESQNAEKVDVLLRDVASKLARAQSKGVMHSNTAARKLSRIAQRISKTRKEQSVQQ